VAVVVITAVVEVDDVTLVVVEVVVAVVTEVVGRVVVVAVVDGVVVVLLQDAKTRDVTSRKVSNPQIVPFFISPPFYFGRLLEN
jgi:hypothetical protein